MNTLSFNKLNRFYSSTIATTVTVVTLLALFSLPSSGQAQDHNIDLLPPDLRGELNNSISQVLNGFFIFSSTDAVSSGQYRVKNSGADKQKFQVLKVSGTHFWGDETEDTVTPFISGQIGSLKQQEQITPFEGDGSNDFSTISSINAGVGAGVAFRFFDALTVSPEFHAIYSHTENHYDFNNQFSQDVLQLFNRDLFNWNIDTITYMPSIGATYEHTVNAITLVPSIKYSQMFIDSTWTNSELLDVNTSTGILNSRLETRIPTSQCLWEKDVELRPFISRTDIYRDARAGLGFGSFYQAGMSVIVATGDSIPYLSTLGIGGSYSWNSDFEGWRLGFEAEFS